VRAAATVACLDLGVDPDRELQAIHQGTGRDRTSGTRAPLAIDLTLEARRRPGRSAQGGWRGKRPADETDNPGAAPHLTLRSAPTAVPKPAPPRRTTASRMCRSRQGTPASAGRPRTACRRTESAVGAGLCSLRGVADVDKSARALGSATPNSATERQHRTSVARRFPRVQNGMAAHVRSCRTQCVSGCCSLVVASARRSAESSSVGRGLCSSVGVGVVHALQCAAGGDRG